MTQTPWGGKPHHHCCCCVIIDGVPSSRRTAVVVAQGLVCYQAGPSGHDILPSTTTKQRPETTKPAAATLVIQHLVLSPLPCSFEQQKSIVQPQQTTAASQCQPVTSRNEREIDIDSNIFSTLKNRPIDSSCGHTWWATQTKATIKPPPPPVQRTHPMLFDAGEDHEANQIFD